MHNNTSKIRLFSLLCLLVAGVVYAKDMRVKSSEKLRNALSKSAYSIVLFYDRSRENMKDKAIKQKINDMETMFRSISEDDFYKDANLQFIRADINRDGLNSVQRQYNLTQIPTFAIFLGRELEAKLYGYQFRDAVEKFIDQHLKSKMEEAIKQADILRKKRLENAKIRAYTRPPYWSPYWYGPYWYTGYYPYWNYGYGRWRPYGGWYF